MATLDTSSFVVLGEGLAAGLGDFTLSEDTQVDCFPAQMARQMGTPFPQRLIQPPGLGYACGFGPVPVVVPSPLQSTVLTTIPPEPTSNLSVPGFTVADASRLRPAPPLVRRHEAKQTAANLLLGIHDIAYGTRGSLATPLERAVRLRPTLALVSLGFVEVLESLVAATPVQLPEPRAFRDDYTTIVSALRSAGAEVMVLTIPDPLDTAYCSTIETAARLLKLDPSLLRSLWTVGPDDLITVPGLHEMAFQLYAGSVGPTRSSFLDLPGGCTIAGPLAHRIRTAVRAFNTEIEQIARAQGAVLYDLHAFMRSVRSAGVDAGLARLSGDYLGGFYTLNGYYPGATGHAHIANELLTLLNGHFSTSFRPVDMAAVRARDPVASYQPADGPNWTLQQLTSPQPLPTGPVPPMPPRSSTASRASDDSSRSTRGTGASVEGHVLKLPPALDQVLPLNPAISYFGDAISAQHCRRPETVKYGTGGNLIFGGLAMMDSHLAGDVRVRFTPPAGDITTFELSIEGSLIGDDSLIAAPILFKLPGKQQRVGNTPRLVATGRLNLRTGQVDPSPDAVQVYVNFFNSALFALLRVNPNFPTDPLSFPGPYGSAWLTFEPRPDGRLDVSFSGSTFVPLGEGARFPLSFGGPSRQFASIPASGTVLHPHISFSTRTMPTPAPVGDVPAIPCNSVQEFTLFTPVSSFGDAFTLDAPAFGGPALGRSRLFGRVQIQFGPQTANSVPIAVSTSVAGGLLAPLDPTPLAALFPGRLTPGPKGFDEFLRFPLRTYPLNDLAILDDPFDIAVGALDVRSGHLLHDLLHRAFINQNLIFALLRVEPRTPQSSFAFRGPATLQKGHGDAAVFKFFGDVHIPYPPGFLFPDPNLATAFVIANGGSLDPYLWMWAMQDGPQGHEMKSGRADRISSSRGEVFSYRFAIQSDPGRASEFEYENHTQQGTFRMHSLAWAGFGCSTAGSGAIDTVTFSAFGVWRKAGIEQVAQATAQFSWSHATPYAGIHVNPDISNVNTPMPPDAFPIPRPLAATAEAGLPSRA